MQGGGRVEAALRVCAPPQVWSRVRVPLPPLTVHGHCGPVGCMVEVGGLLISGSDDNTLRVFDLIKQECVHVVRDAHTGGVGALVVVPAHALPHSVRLPQSRSGVLMSASKAGTVKVGGGGEGLCWVRALCWPVALVAAS